MLENFKDLLKLSLKDKKINKLVMWNMVLKSVEKYFLNRVKVSGYVKNFILFLKPNPIEMKVELFLQKTEIIKIINQKINEYWYDYEIKNIIIL